MISPLNQIQFVHGFLPIFSLQISDNEMSSGHILKMAQEDGIDESSPTAKIIGTAEAAAFPDHAGKLILDRGFEGLLLPDGPEPDPFFPGQLWFLVQLRWRLPAQGIPYAPE